MFGSSVLEVIIGVVFVFLLVSLLVTAANELLANVLQSRAKFLWKGVTAMLEPGGPVVGDASGLVGRLFQHPFIRGLSPGGGQVQRKPGPPLKTSSYIPSGVFAAALLDLLGAARAASDEGPQKLRARLAALPAKGDDAAPVRGVMENTAAELGAAPAGPGNSALTGRLTDWLNQWPATRTDYPAALQSAREVAAESPANAVRQTLEALPAGDVRQTLLTLFDDAGGNYDQFKANVAAWYDTIMDRVSGWYNRRTAWVTLLLGALLAVVLDVDAVLIMHRLSADPALRDAMVAEARNFTPKAPVPVEGSLPAPVPPGADPNAEIDRVYARLNSLSLPIGWTTAPPPTPGGATPTDLAVAERRLQPDFAALVHAQGAAWTALRQTVSFHLFGWLLTAVAASLGAPFWFDVLDRLMNIRQTGDRPKKAKNARTTAPSFQL